MIRRTMTALVGVMLTTVAASAQTASGDSGKVYVEGFAGLSRANGTNSGMFGGEAGFQVMEKLEIFGNVGYVRNIFPEGERKALEEGCEGIPCVANARLTFFTAGAKYVIPAGSRIRPYVAAGIGAARMSVTFEIDGEDVTDEIQDIAGGLTTTSGLLELGGGFDLAVGAKGKVDIGYRMMRILEEDRAAHRVYAGFGWRF